jgi:hypothetical protein
MYVCTRAPKLSARLVGVSRKFVRTMVVLGELEMYLESVFRLLSKLPLIPNQVSSLAPFSHPTIGEYLHKVETKLHCPLMHGLVDKQSMLEVHGTGGAS